VDNSASSVNRPEHSTYKSGKAVQTNGATSNDAAILRLWTDEIAAGSYYHFKLTVLDAVEVRNGNPVE